MHRGCLLALTILLVSACSDPDAFDRGFHSSELPYLQEVTDQIRSAGIEVRIGNSGMITYRNRDHERVAEILKRADAEFHNAEETKWETDEHRQYFIEILKASNIKYREEPRPDGVWIRWYPRNAEEARELQARALERVIADRKPTTMSVPCPLSKGAPSNFSLNKDAAKSRSAC
jgi:hypothetical protein